MPSRLLNPAILRPSNALLLPLMLNIRNSLIGFIELDFNLIHYYIIARMLINTEEQTIVKYILKLNMYEDLYLSFIR